MQVRIVLADDHAIIREGLRTLLIREKDLEVVAEASDGREALRLARELNPHVVIMDVSMPGLTGMEAAAKIRAECPGVRVIALSMHSDRRFVGGMLKAGAKGYLLKDCAFEELARAVREVAAGGMYLSPGITGVVVEDYIKQARSGGPEASSMLSSREREVLQLMAEGLGTKEIGLKLDISPKTVETHRRQMMAKLGIHTIAELTKYAVREGLTSLD